MLKFTKTLDYFRTSEGQYLTHMQQSPHWERHIYIKKDNVYKQSECSIIWGGKGKMLALIKIVKVTQEFKETLEVVFY